jgi:hypothetical protein
MTLRIRHESCQLPSWLIFDVRPKNTAMRSFSMQSRKQGGDPIVFRGSSVRASIVGGFGLARLHRPGAPRWRLAQRTRGPELGSAAAPLRSQLPCSVLGSVFYFASNSRVSLAQHCSNRPSPNKSPEPTTFAVTSRATVRLSEMKQRNPNWDIARAAPAKVVAHL